MKKGENYQDMNLNGFKTITQFHMKMATETLTYKVTQNTKFLRLKLTTARILGL